MVQKGEHALCAKVHHTCHSPTRTRVLLHAAENPIVCASTHTIQVHCPGCEVNLDEHDPCSAVQAKKHCTSQGWPVPYTYTIYDRIFNEIATKNVFTYHIV